MTTLVRIVLLLAVLAPSLARAGSDGPPPGIMRVGMGGPFHGPMPFGDDPGLMLPMLLQGVGLTDDQKKEVRDILKADRGLLTADQLAKAADVKTKMRALRAQMRDLLGEPGANPLGEPD